MKSSIGNRLNVISTAVQGLAQNLPGHNKSESRGDETILPIIKINLICEQVISDAIDNTFRIQYYDSKNATYINKNLSWLDTIAKKALSNMKRNSKSEEEIDQADTNLKILAEELNKCERALDVLIYENGDALIPKEFEEYKELEKEVGDLDIKKEIFSVAVRLLSRGYDIDEIIEQNFNAKDTGLDLAYLSEFGIDEDELLGKVKNIIQEREAKLEGSAEVKRHTLYSEFQKKERDYSRTLSRKNKLQDVAKKAYNEALLKAATPYKNQLRKEVEDLLMKKKEILGYSNTTFAEKIRVFFNNFLAQLTNHIYHISKKVDLEKVHNLKKEDIKLETKEKLKTKIDSLKLNMKPADGMLR